MRVRVLAFAGLAARLGWRERVFEDVEAGSAVAALLARLARDYPLLERYPFTVAVDGEYLAAADSAAGAALLSDGAEVALIPPVSGG